MFSLFKGVARKQLHSTSKYFFSNS